MNNDNIANTHEENLRSSFKNVKNDVIELKNYVEQLTSTLNGTLEQLQTLRAQHEIDMRRISHLSKNKQATKLVVKKIVKKQKQKIIANKTGEGKAHFQNCPFAKNIKKKITFKTKTAAFKKGYKACSCLRK